MYVWVRTQRVQLLKLSKTLANFGKSWIAAFPAMTALKHGYTTYAAIDASGAFSKAQAEMGVLRMVQAGVVPVCYSNVAVEILADNAAPEANAVYAALGMPFASLVGGMNQYFSNK